MKIEVYVRENAEERKIAEIKKYYKDERHINRKWCYSIGIHTYYSETAKNANEMILEYIENEIDWAYCASENLEVIFKAVSE